MIPFETSESFSWSRLAALCIKIVDGNHNPPKGQNHKTNYLMLSSQNINNDSVISLELGRFITKEQFAIENQRTRIQKEDILFTSVGTLGRSCVYRGPLNICFQRSVSVIHTLLNPDYLKMFFDSPTYQNMIIKVATGTAQKGFYLNQLAASLICYPSLETQHRIVEKYKLLLCVMQ